MTKLIIADVDGCLYPYDCTPEAMQWEVMQACAQAARELSDNRIPIQDAFVLAVEGEDNGLLWQEFTRQYGISQKDIHARLHEKFDDQRIHYNSRLIESIEALRKKVTLATYTHAHQSWLDKVLNRLAITEDHIDPRLRFSLETVGFAFKNMHHKGFEQITATAESIIGERLEEVIVLEDSPANLIIPKKRYATTVYIHHGKGEIEGDHIDHQYERPEHALEEFALA